MKTSYQPYDLIRLKKRFYPEREANSDVATSDLPYVLLLKVFDGGQGLVRFNFGQILLIDLEWIHERLTLHTNHKDYMSTAMHTYAVKTVIRKNHKGECSENAEYIELLRSKCKSWVDDIEAKTNFSQSSRYAEHKQKIIVATTEQPDTIKSEDISELIAIVKRYADEALIIQQDMVKFISNIQRDLGGTDNE